MTKALSGGLWAGEKVRPESSLPAPTIDQRLELEPGKQVINLPAWC